MTYQDEELVRKVQANIGQSRDIIGYMLNRHGEPLTEDERKKLNECQTHLCMASKELLKD